jgi:hypothetical protein
MDAYKTVTATFDVEISPPTQFTLTATAGAGGTVATDPAGPLHNEGSTVTVTATPGDADTVFTGWTGDVPDGSEMTNPLVITMDADKTIAAGFMALPAAADYKITYKKCALAVDEITSGVASFALSGGSDKSSIKIQRLKKLPKKMTEKEGTKYLLGLRLISELGITGAFGKIACDAEVDALVSDGSIKSVTTKIANIAAIDTGAIATIKMTALRDDKAEVAATTILTAGSGDMKLTLTGVVLENLVTTQACKYIKLASKAWKDKVTKAKNVSLGGAGSVAGGASEITAAGAKTIQSTGGAIAVDRIQVGQDVTNLKAKSKKLNGVDYAATLGTPGAPEATQVLAPNIKNIEGTAGVAGIFVMGFDGNGDPTYAGAIKSIKVKTGAIEGEAHVSPAAKPIKFKPAQGDFVVLTEAP